METLAALWREERPNLPLWAPVLLGLGVQVYFWSPAEPGWLVYALAFAAACAALRAGRLAFAILFLLALGFAAAGLRANLVAAPVLEAGVSAAVEGRIRDITRSESGRPRLVLDRVHIFGLPEDRQPARAQVSLRSDAALDGLAPGTRVSLMARVGPPGAPVEPGGFDYRRHAWFKQLGAVGYATGPPAGLAAAPPDGPLDAAALAVTRWRLATGAAIRARLPGEEGAFAAAVMVGDRAAVPAEATQALRDSNLAHLLAISGLHVGLVTALVFAAVRIGLAALPGPGVRWRVKTIAAGLALAAAAGYLVASGASIATQRAFIMAMVALCAVMLNRPALTLRALGAAAIIILLLRPESLVHVGFQMSFAATAAIIAGFDALRALGWKSPAGARGARIAGFFAILAATSILAGAATAPYAAHHFNRIAVYGLPANLAAVPVMSLWVAPTGVVAAALAPFGLEEPALRLMGAGVSAIMSVARFFAGLDGATRAVPSAPALAMILLTLGGLGLCLGRRLARGAAAAAAAVALSLWAAGAPRPDLLVLDDRPLIGALSDAGRILDHDSAAGHAAKQWLRNDGDGASQKEAAARAPAGAGALPLRGGWRVVHVLKRSRGAPDCVAGLILADRSGVARPDGPCLIISKADLAANGAHAVWTSGELRVETVAARAGRRLWTLRPGVQ